MVYSPAGKVFPETAKLKGTLAWTPPRWAWAGTTASPIAKQTLATIKV